jgi:hypothetical protein
MTRQTTETRAKSRTSASRAKPAIPPPAPREASKPAKTSKPTKTSKPAKASKAPTKSKPAASNTPASNGRIAVDFDGLVAARPTRAERSVAEDRSRRVDEVCAAWAAIVAERMAADQAFAELYEHFRGRSGDLRSLFAWDALHHAEAHLALVNSTIARHLSDDGRADPRVILADLRWERRKVAAVYAVNAFVAVLNQMGPTKAKWLEMQEFDPKIAVLALAHQTLHYALESIRVEAPADLTEAILRASQDESAWAVQHRNDLTRLASAASASAVFFRLVGATELVTAEEVASLYATRARKK